MLGMRINEMISVVCKLHVVHTWFSKNGKKSELATSLDNRLASLTKSKAGRTWVNNLQGDVGSFIAVQPVEHIRGLPGYPPIGFWQKLFGRCDPMELVVAETALLLFDPKLAINARYIKVPYCDISSCDEDHAFGSTLIVKTSLFKTTFSTGYDFSARPIKEVIRNAIDATSEQTTPRPRLWLIAVVVGTAAVLVWTLAFIYGR